MPYASASAIVNWSIPADFRLYSAFLSAMVNTKTRPQTTTNEALSKQAQPAPIEPGQSKFNPIETILTVLCALFLVGGVIADQLGTNFLFHTALYLGSYLTGG